MISEAAPTKTVDAKPVSAPEPITNPWLVLLKNAPWMAGPLIVFTVTLPIGLINGGGYNAEPRDIGTPPVFTSPTATICGNESPGTFATNWLESNAVNAVELIFTITVL